MKRNNKIIAVTFAIILFCLLVATTTVCALANDGSVIFETLNITEARKNMNGPGYQWANRFNELTLNGLYIDTEDAYGLKLPKDSTVILNGNNYIKAAKYGVSCSGTITFKGNGTLIIDAGDTGIYLISQNNTHKIRLLEGNYIINAGKNGVYSDYADFSFVGKSMNINVEDENGLAISGRCVNLLGGSFVANAPVNTSHELVVDALNIKITSNRPALSSPKLKIDHIDFDDIDTYTSENSINGTALKRFHSKSIILGNNVAGWVDYIFLLGFAALVTALIAIPTIRKKKKSKLVLEKLKNEGYITE